MTFGRNWLDAQIVVGAVLFALAFWTATTISVYRRWDNNPYGGRQAKNQSASVGAARQPEPLAGQIRADQPLE